MTDLKNLANLARQQRRQGQFAAAAQTFREAIAQTEDRNQLAELYGMLGGTLREQGDLVDAAASYDRGFEYEVAESTYNELNRLVTRVLIEPRCLAEPETLRAYEELPYLDVPEQLALVKPQLEAQIEGARNADYWGMGDLAVVCALLGDEAGMLSALDRFEACLPPASAAAKYYDTFAALAAVDTAHDDLLTLARDRIDR